MEHDCLDADYEFSTSHFPVMNRPCFNQLINQTSRHAGDRAGLFRAGRFRLCAKSAVRVTRSYFHLAFESNRNGNYEIYVMNLR